MRTHNRKLKIVSLYPTTGDMQAVYVGKNPHDVEYCNVPESYVAPEWLQARFGALAMLPTKMYGIPSDEIEIGSVIRYTAGFVVYQARVPDEHADMWSELL
jgi:hypothetical protein